MTKKTVFIVGAGFSANAGMPLQSEFTKQLLKAHNFKRGPSKTLVTHLDNFVEKVFGWKRPMSLELYPELEDIFTSIDLSANSGHHLGTDYDPQKLRRIRRTLISRTIRMLYNAYLKGKDEDAPLKTRKSRSFLLKLLSQINPDKHSFVSLNWDGVLEGCIEELNLPLVARYSTEIESCDIEERILVRKAPNKGSLFVSKVHGSVNWLYCDCCRRTFSIPVGKVLDLADQVLHSDEVRKPADTNIRIHCPECDVDLGVRLATFSYQKALRSPMFESSWLQAEKLLRDADKWVFIGYSLPEADFEFKYLLKRVELAKKQRPKLQVVTVNGIIKGKDSSTVRSYKKFFGNRKIEFFCRGLNLKVISKIIE